MAVPFTIRSEELRPLAPLASLHLGLRAYYLQLSKNPDIIVAVGAYCGLLEMGELPFPMWEDVFALCRFGAVRRRAVTFFDAIFRPDLALRAAQVPLQDDGDLEQQIMIANLRLDPAAACEAEGLSYLHSCDLAALSRAADLAEESAGWRDALKWVLRASLITPLHPGPPSNIYALLIAATRDDLMVEVANLFLSKKIHLPIAQLFLARAQISTDPAQALKKLALLDDDKVKSNKDFAPFLSAIRSARADAEEKLGNYRKAYEIFSLINQSEKSKDYNGADYFTAVTNRARLAIPNDLPPPPAKNVVHLVGFPRSGTTLLENILDAHPSVETFEEINAAQAAVNRIERARLGRAPAESPEATFAAAKSAYYDDIERRQKKPNATVLVDKMPMRSGDAAFYAKLFPEWRYIFSIRHPFDVVLSGFKQRFKPNSAMENFRTIEGAVKLYDFVMTNWFAQHSMDDASVLYVKYDDLVLDFETTTRGAFDFLGVPWVEEVRDFAKRSEERRAKTPSYAKVRQGLSIGVQSSWRNYDFLFKSKAAQPLYKWAEKFGYPTN